MNGVHQFIGTGGDDSRPCRDSSRLPTNRRRRTVDHPSGRTQTWDCPSFGPYAARKNCPRERGSGRQRTRAFTSRSLNSFCASVEGCGRKFLAGLLPGWNESPPSDHKVSFVGVRVDADGRLYRRRSNVIIGRKDRVIDVAVDLEDSGGGLLI